MAKAVKKKAIILDSKNLKSPKEASTIFHNIMAASVKGNPKPKVSPQDKIKVMQIVSKHLDKKAVKK